MDNINHPRFKKDFVKLRWRIILRTQTSPRMRYFGYKLFKINKLKAFYSLLTLTLVFCILSVSKAAVTPENGEKLFKQYCTSCHKLDSKLIGPALRGIEGTQSEEWLTRWIKNNTELRKSGDKAALAIFDQYGHTEMPTFTDFSDDDVKSILAYIKTAPAPGAGGAQGKPGAATQQEYDYQPILWIVLVVFALLVFLLARINSNLSRLVQEREGQQVSPPFSIVHFLKQKSTIAAALLILIALGGYTTVEQTQKLGRSRGYSPEQPIHYSHRLHAGINGINCLYCHVGAEKGKAAAIPTINICMNCHKGVQQGESDAGTAEIAKILDAYKNNKPVKWIRIHNLPDHVYFNHSQHVKVGKIECQTCHGPIQTEDQVYQYTSLSMGWCINCHRETKVQFASNNYYSMFEKLHEDLKNGKIDAVTEGMMGGTECQKCHY